jgi:hypothetical protein
MATTAITMKSKLLYYFVFVPLFTMRAYADDLKPTQWGPLTNNVKMSIRLKGNNYPIEKGQPIKLIISYTTVSTNEIFSVSCANYVEHDSSYTFYVSPNMNKIAESESRGGFNLRPNHTNEIEFNLSKLCKFNELGTYKIIAKKMVYQPRIDKAFAVVSNPLYVSVVSNK